MPKEILRENSRKNKGPYLDVRWGKDQHGYVEIGIDREIPFVFVDKNNKSVDEDNEITENPEVYTGLNFIFYDEDDVDKLIWTLKRAKKQTFGS